ncbi:MAG TPA: hypothetical protein VI485_10700 [Vicinamibacterales bacterium]|nr:hypothetical protein [Vicinamibacterales bacterium]
MHGRRSLALCIAAIFISAAPSLIAQRNNDNGKKPPQSTRSPQEQQDIQSLVQLVDNALAADVGVPMTPPAGNSAPPAPPTPTTLSLGAPDRTQGDIKINWDQNHFVKGQTDTYIPFTLTLDRAKLAGGAAIYVRVVNVDQAAAFGSAIASLMAPAQGNKPNASVARPTFAWDNANFIDIPEGGSVSRAVQLKPGQYVMYLAIKEKSAAPAGANQKNDRNNRNQPPAAGAPPATFGLLRHELTVPDFTGPDLTTSSVIVARSVDPVTAPPTDQESNPYVFGPMRIVPSPDGKFAKSAELSIIFWIYGAQAAASGKPDVTIDFNFHQKLPDGEKYFNKTSPQQLNATTLPPEFSVAAGHQLPGSLVVPLSSFPAGDYRLEIKVTDKASGKSVTQNVNFTVLPV